MISVAGALLGFLGLFVLYEATDRLFAGALTVGDFGILFGYYGQIVGSSRAMGQLWIDLQDNVIAMQRVSDLLEAPIDHEPAQPVPLGPIREGVRFEGVVLPAPAGPTSATISPRRASKRIPSSARCPFGPLPVTRR